MQIKQFFSINFQSMKNEEMMCVCKIKTGKSLPQRAKMKPGTGLIFKHPHKGKAKRAKRENERDNEMPWVHFETVRNPTRRDWFLFFQPQIRCNVTCINRLKMKCKFNSPKCYSRCTEKQIMCILKLLIACLFL